MDDVTGTMNVAPETVINMDGEDHQSIVRYDSDQNPSYRKVLGVLTEAVNHAVNRESHTTHPLIPLPT